MDMWKSVATKLVAGHGWRASAGTALALKSYATAVGPKDAQAYLVRSGDGRFVLTATYYSEGRDVLSTVRVPTDVTMEDEHLDLAVKAFSAEIDARVADTYAVRLLGMGGAGVTGTQA